MKITKMVFMVFIVLMVFIGVPKVKATETLGTFQQNQCVTLRQVCGNCTYVNVTSVLAPNSTSLLGMRNMTKVGTDYNLNFCTTGDLGQYIVNGFGDNDGIPTVFSYNFFVTKSGLDTAGDVFTVIINIMFIIAIIGLIWTLFLTIAKIATIDESVFDVLVAWGFYILLLLTIYLSKTYLISTFIDNFGDPISTATMYTHGVLPPLALIITIWGKSLQKKKPLGDEIMGRGFK